MSTSSDAVRVSRVLHAGYIFESGATRVVFDPLFETPFSRNCHAFPSVRFDHAALKHLRFDAVFISHFHDDHCSLESLDLIDRRTPIYAYCLFDELFDWIRELGFVEVHHLHLNQRVCVGDFQITPRRALDSDIDSIFQIEAGGVKILNIVDSWIDDDTLELLVREGPWDLALWPFQTMREIEVIAPRHAARAEANLPKEWIEQLKRLLPRWIVPSSCQFKFEPWSWYNGAFFPVSYRRFQNEVETALPSSKVIRLDPSRAIEISRAGVRDVEPLHWVVPVGESGGDYEYEFGQAPPPTSEISRHFPALDSKQEKLVLEYCERRIFDRFQTIGASADPYFGCARRWRLSVYDHDGRARHFEYDLQGPHLQLASGDRPLGWQTEVPMARLYGALENGESLTSMYVRINDSDFDGETAAALQNVEVTEDPLLRCLFNGIFGAYQVSQLQRLIR